MKTSGRILLSADVVLGKKKILERRNYCPPPTVLLECSGMHIKVIIVIFETLSHLFVVGFASCT